MPPDFRVRGSVKGQQLFYSFLPSVTVAVLTTQPSWANTAKVSEVQLFASPNTEMSTPSGTLANQLDTQLFTANSNSLGARLTTTGATAYDVQSWSSNITMAEKTSMPIGHIIRENQGVVFNLTPALNSSHQDGNLLAFSNQKQSYQAIALAQPQNKVTLTNTAILSVQGKSLPGTNSQPLIAEKKNLSTQLSTISDLPVRSAAAKLAEVQFCPEGNGKTRTADLPFPSACSQQNTISGNKVAQGRSQNPTPATPVVPGTAPTTPATSTTPGPIPASIPVSPATTVPAGSVQPAPSYLNPNPNPLQFPTKPSEVRIQGTQPITLAQALELARRNNRQLQASLLTLEQNQAALRQTQASLLPTANIQTAIQRVGSSNGGQLNDGQSSSQFSGTASLNYDLYTSGQRLASIRAAEEQVRYYRLDVERQSEDTRLNVTTAYYNLQSADQQVRIQQAAVTNAQASLRDTQALERAGVGTRFEVLQAQVNLATYQQSLTNAFAQQRITRRSLAQILSLSQAVDISAADPVTLAGLWNQSLEQSIVLAFQNRPELQQQLAQRNINEQRRRGTLAQLGPQVSLVAQYGISDVFNDTRSVDDNYAIGVRANLLLFDGGAVRAQADQYKAATRTTEVQFADTRNQIRFQVEQAYFQLQSNLENVQTANVALEQAREALRLARLRFQAGVGTQTDVINQETALTQSEGNRITAIINYNLALTQIQRYVTARAFSR
ncbi:MAG: TolC family protein [Rhizonema sp. NSF051]|nr:TolC family protein [Rhizonema sp. NSF051]